MVLEEMPLSRFEECWPLPKESLPELPYNFNIVTLTQTLWPINTGVLTSLLLPHLSSSLTDSLPSLSLLCHSKNSCSIHARCSKSSLKHSIRFCGIFSKFKKNVFVYRSSKVSDCIFEIHQHWQSGFSRVYSNCCCSCSFEPKILKIGLSSHKMYSNNTLDFQESTTILNACTKKSGNLSYVPRICIISLSFIYTLNGYQVFNSLEDLCIKRVARLSYIFLILVASYRNSRGSLLLWQQETICIENRLD